MRIRVENLSVNALSVLAERVGWANSLLGGTGGENPLRVDYLSGSISSPSDVDWKVFQEALRAAECRMPFLPGSPYLENADYQLPLDWEMLDYSGVIEN